MDPCASYLVQTSMTPIIQHINHQRGTDQWRRALRITHKSVTRVCKQCLLPKRWPWISCPDLSIPSKAAFLLSIQAEHFSPGKQSTEGRTELGFILFYSPNFCSAPVWVLSSRGKIK